MIQMHSFFVVILPDEDKECNEQGRTRTEEPPATVVREHHVHMTLCMQSADVGI